MADGVGGRRGASLRHAFQPETEAEKNLLIAGHTCAACGLADAVQTEGSPPRNLGFVVFLEVVKTCACNFQNRIFLIINNIMRKSIPYVREARAALDAAEKRGLLPDPRIDEVMVDLLLADQRGDITTAVTLAETLTALDQFNPHFWYNLAWFYGEAGSNGDAVAAYERCLSLAPDFADAWYNQGIMAARLGDYNKARECLEHFHRLRPESGGGVFQDVKMLFTTQGLSGEVNVVEDKSCRRLRIESQTQSSAFLNPPASQFVPTVGAGPGALPSCFYLSAWFMVGYGHPNGHGLVLGLGGGAGLVALLTQFPDMRLTVVEIDPQIIEAVKEWFPLVRHYADLGRLSIVNADAKDFVKNPSGPYDFAIIDLYTGQVESPAFSRSPEFLGELGKLTPNIWTNLISNQEGTYLRDTFRAFALAGLPLQHVFTTISPRSRAKIGSNWITSTESVDLAALRDFTVFPDLEPCAELDIVRGNFQILNQWAIPAEEIRLFIETGRFSSDGEETET